MLFNWLLPNILLLLFIILVKLSSGSWVFVWALDIILFLVVVVVLLVVTGVFALNILLVWTEDLLLKMSTELFVELLFLVKIFYPSGFDVRVLSWPPATGWAMFDVEGLDLWTVLGWILAKGFEICLKTMWYPFNISSIQLLITNGLLSTDWVWLFGFELVLLFTNGLIVLFKLLLLLVNILLLLVLLLLLFLEKILLLLLLLLPNGLLFVLLLPKGLLLLLLLLANGLLVEVLVLLVNGFLTLLVVLLADGLLVLALLLFFTNGLLLVLLDELFKLLLGFDELPNILVALLVDEFVLVLFCAFEFPGLKGLLVDWLLLDEVFVCYLF